jgi:hypothetical protein
MTDKNLREIIEDASSAFSTYKHPQISEARVRLNGIIKAAGLGDLEHESIDGICFRKGMIEVCTTYSIRGCSMSGEYVFPASILDEADPLAAAKRWGLEQKVSNARESVDECRRDLAGREETLAEALAELAKLDAAFI